MSGEIASSLRRNLRDKEYSEGYAESYLNSFVATQIKVIREQRRMTQEALGQCIGTTQAGISRYENVDYSSWSVRTLIKLARAFNVRLKVSFEPYGTLPDEVVRFDRQSLERVERDKDPELEDQPNPMQATLRNRDGNIVPIDIYKVLAATEDLLARKKEQKEVEEEDWSNYAYRQISSGGAQ
jgi:transcriptional regulator with XRE-family HTH domain